MENLVADAIGTQPESEAVAEQAPVSEAQGTETAQEDRGQGGELPNWATQLPGQYREYAKGFDTYADFVAASATALEKTKNSVIVPGEDASPEAVQEFWAAVGVPESAEGYKLAFDEGIEYDQDGIAAYKEAALEANLTPQQAQYVMDWFAKASVEADARRMEDNRKEGERSLREEWGTNYDRNFGCIARALKTFASDDLIEELATSDLGNNPAFLKFLSKVGDMLTEEGAVDGATTAGDSRESFLKEMYPSMYENS
jgi:hypothetical protein